MSTNSNPLNPGHPPITMGANYEQYVEDDNVDHHGPFVAYLLFGYRAGASGP